MLDIRLQSCGWCVVTSHLVALEPIHTVCRDLNVSRPHAFKFDVVELKDTLQIADTWDFRKPL